MNAHLDRILHGSLANWIQLLGRGILWLIELGVLYRYCSVEVVGIWLIFLSVGALINLTDLGIGPTLSRFTAFHTPRDLSPLSANEATPNYQAIRNLMASTYALGGAFALGLLGAALWAEPIVAVRFAGPLDRSSFAVVWMLFAAGIAVLTVGSIPLRVLNGLGDLAREQYLRLGLTCTRFAMDVVSVMLGWGLLGLAVSTFLYGVLTWLVSSLALFWAYPGLRQSRGRVDLRIVREIVGPSARWLLMTVGALMIFNSSNVVIGWFLGPAAVSDYAALYQLMWFGLSLILAVPNAFVPFIARAYAHQETEAIRPYHQLSVKLALILAAWFAVVLWFWAEDIVRLWLGPGHFVGRSVLGLFLVLMVLECHHVANAACTMALNKIPFGPWAIAAGVLNLVFAVVFVQRWGLVGVALAVVIAQLMTNNWFAVYYTLRVFRMSYAHYWARVLSPVLWIVIPLSVLAFLLRYLLGSALWEMLLSVVLLALVFVVLATVIVARSDPLIQAQLTAPGRAKILSGLLSLEKSPRQGWPM